LPQTSTVSTVTAMRREQLQREIARLDEEINQVISSTEIPRLDMRPFPTGTWIFAILCFAWSLFGGLIPGAGVYHMETAGWAWIAGIVFVILAVISTISWFLRRRGYKERSGEYLQASRQARELQEKRRDLQAELRSLNEE
jgi:type VI protein secretion system component VasK